MRTIIRLLPSFGAFAWVLWYCVQAKWSEVVIPNAWGLITVTTITTVLLWVITKTGKPEIKALTKTEGVIPTERLVAREVWTWKTVTRKREVYQEK